MGQIITREEFARMRSEVDNKVIVLCHGVFDLVHPGHILHFEEAKKQGDILVVSITADRFVRKGPGRPYFSEDLRMKFLSVIEIIDFIILSEDYTVDDIIECVKPDVYVKGQEYAKAENDITGMIDKESALVEAYGGKVYFTCGQVFSSTKLINNEFNAFSEEVKIYLKEIRNQYTLDDLQKYIEMINKLKILVVGDIIIDKYMYCTVQGLMSKDMGYSARWHASEEYWGGAAAVARHLCDFSSYVTLASVMGDEPGILDKLKEDIGSKINLKICQSVKYNTIVKKRYLSKNDKREEYHKIFAVNNIHENVVIDSSLMKEFEQNLSMIIEEFDAVIVCDFGHGIMNKKVMDIVQSKAKFLALNCQTNSTNMGLNIITKYSRADAFALDQKELRLAYPGLEFMEEKALYQLSTCLNSQGWLTRGAKGAYGVSEERIEKSPAFTLSVKDTVGAGDAFFAIAGMFAAVSAPIEVSTFAGNIAGALAVNIVGNKEAIEKVNFLKFASTLLNI